MSVLWRKSLNTRAKYILKYKVLNLNMPKHKISLQVVSIPYFSPSNIHLRSDSSLRYADKYFCAFLKSNSKQSVV